MLGLGNDEEAGPMEWRDEGILLRVRRHGESSAIIEALTANHGRHAGMVRGGATRKWAAVLQPGAQLSLNWRARLETHLGTYTVDLDKGRAADILSDRNALAALNAISAMIGKLLPEREPAPEIYVATTALADSLGNDPRWPELYAHWEVALLASLGYGLDLNNCAATGVTGDLHFVSPKTGRAVCREAGAPYADKLFGLPQFLLGRGRATSGSLRAALRLTSYFFEKWVCPAMDIEELPNARNRLVGMLEHFNLHRCRLSRRKIRTRMAGGTTASIVRPTKTPRISETNHGTRPHGAGTRSRVPVIG